MLADNRLENDRKLFSHQEAVFLRDGVERAASGCRVAAGAYFCIERKNLICKYDAHMGFDIGQSNEP
jgi:hypothetical protein